MISVIGITLFRVRRWLPGEHGEKARLPIAAGDAYDRRIDAELEMLE